MSVKYVLALSVLCLLSLDSCQLLTADELIRPPARERPRIPAQLDTPTLKNLLDTIDQPNVASALKVSYFGGRANAQSLPVSEGLKLLKAAIAAEPVASKRWFWLQNVRGWAAFRCKEISPDEGFAAYSELFAQANKAKAAGTVYAPQTALIDWIATINGRMGSLTGADGESLRYDERTTGVLLEAWSAYVSLLQQTEGRWNGREPDWSRAFERAGASDELLAAIEKTLADPAAPKTFTLLHSAATALRSEKPQRALELFAQAGVLLPKDRDGEIERRIAEQFFDDWFSLARESDAGDGAKKAQALDVARARMAALGSGHAKLLKLQLDGKDEAGVSATLELLSKTDAPEREVVAAGKVLNDLWEKNRADAKLAAQSQALLSEYLKAERERAVAVEIEARYRLGWLLIQQKQIEAAKAALDVSQMKFDAMRLDSSTLFMLQTLHAMREKIAEK